MKPIRLTIAGLHSFRERQEINFTLLTDTGMFGIFGPTGSGKSTILDAITLALYGEVGRTSRKQGILNHAEKQVAVSFEFEIGRKDARKRYQVDRIFKRATGYAVAHHSSRLMELEGSEATDVGIIVLAEGNQAVNQMIRNLIGLEPQDFTRAVVLPQGKFAEFLQLTGANRNQMAERLFGLEQYGQALSGKINELNKQKINEKQQVLAAQSELGDASEEAVKQAETALLSASEAKDAATKELGVVKRQYEEAKDVFALQVQFEKANQAKATHEELTGEIEHVRKRIEIAVRAERVWPIIESKKALVLQVEQMGVRHTNALASEKLTRQALDVAKERLKQSQLEKEEKEPALHTQMGQLEEAFLLEEEIREREIELANVKREQHEASLQIQAASDRKTALHRQVEHLNAEVVKTEKLLDSHLVPPLVRQQTQQLQLLASQWQQDKKAHDLLLEEVQARETNIVQDQEKLARLSDRLSNSHGEKENLQREMDHLLQQNPERTVTTSTLETWLAALKPFVTMLGEAEQSAAQLDANIQSLLSSKSDLEGRFEAALGRVESVEQKFLQKVAAKLQEGDPCPVCGATHHPQPLHMGASIGLSEEVANEQIEDAYEQVETFRADLAKAEAALQQSQEELTRRQGEIKVYRSRALQLWEEQQVGGIADPLWDGARWNQAIRDAERDLTAIRNARMEWDKLVDNVSQRQKEVDEFLQITEKDLSVMQSRLSGSEHELDKQKNALVNLQGNMDDKQTEWQLQIREFGLPDAEDVEKGAKAIQAKAALWLEFDRLAAAERVEVANLRTTLEKYQAELADAEQAIHLATRKAEEGTSRTTLLLQEWEGNKQRLQQLVGERTATQVKESVNRALDALQKQLVLSMEAEKEANDNFSKAMQERVIAETELSTGQHALLEAEQKVNRALEEEKFITTEEVRDALLSHEEQADFFQRVRQFDEEGLQIQAVLDEVSAQLGGRSIDQEAWDKVQSTLKQGEKKHQETLTNHVQAEMRLDDIRVKHLRWTELDEARAKLEAKVNQLQLLKDLLRGNSFVEFMAREQMVSVARQASVRLSSLTRGRYSLELMADGEFVMRDHHNGGVTRPVTTLSGGETFLTSLALALSLSAHIQLRGKYPLEFFFLDEGFGTLDQELLDVVVTELEKLHMDNMAIGVISHVPELRQSLQRRLIVEPAEPAGRGSRLKLEHA